ncbi:PadR family transcriptional regulator [Catellatospora sichuanensis]|uniref:PadR family transcriptional regulator n=1 Tax=Catellatospora sichuanensis TaxID=1969805 RepID=UPI001642F037|nr:PadR family transcriptional regulator [Catellatospora sichuanensis]
MSELTGTASVSRLRRELARGTVELVVLSILNTGRCYGYELLKLVEQAGAGRLEVKEGTLYPLLHRLEDTGQITASWEAVGRTRPRKYYAITAGGRGHLQMLRTEWTDLVNGMQQLLHTLDDARLTDPPAEEAP